ncbi:hypothetical protein BKA93DRAFT_774471 [Sparassis latifolia]|uniref:Autophagy-related protein 11 n=1 Tax=Sparassis crispa TaxID=139825 RepID=A0A401H2U6_9APHY|nr:hypothetical protein SCP_1401710 [Sparassis crispa]GBE88766.1 hypothetical protein SCP_1401710 [Sparassis crispa]
MIQICRAEDGEVLELGMSLWELERLGNLESHLEEKTGVSQDAILAYLSDGRRLRDENIRDLAGVQDQIIYVFNKRYLDLDLNQVLHELWVEPELEPAVEDAIASTPPFRISQLGTMYVQAAHAHHERIQHTLFTLQYQQSALRIASSALDLHVLAIVDVFDGISAAAERELTKQAALLTGLGADLEIVGQVGVHKEFMSLKVRQAMANGEPQRKLGDYVSVVKMQQVAESCTKAHGELLARFEQVQHAMLELNQGADEVRASVSDHSLVEDAEASAHRAQEIFDKVAELDALLERPVSSPEKLLQEFRQFDGSMRGELQFITRIKNSYSEQCINALRRISTLNSDLVELPPSLTSLQAVFKAKTSFSHIQRLHSMLYAYGATVIEIVRRKEFARFFYQRTQSILEIMAKLSANERKRRQAYRGEVHGQLPFEAHGMDDPVPSIDFSPTASPDSFYSLERADIDDLIRMLDALEQFAQTAQGSAAALSSVKEARAGLERLIGKMDSLEPGFDRIAERSLLSASWLSSSRRRSPDDGEAYAQLEAQLEELRQSKAQQEAEFQHERSALQEDITQLRQSFDASEGTRAQLERDLRATRAQLDSESKSRRILEERNVELSSDADGNRQSLVRALAKATEQTKTAEILRQELTQIRSEFQDIKEMEKRHSEKIVCLLEEQALTLGRLEDARARGEDLELQIRTARTESEDMKRALSEAGKEKDRLLRAQVSEHDRVMRDHIAEADGDRAVLEHQFSELKADLEDTERQLKDARSQADMALGDAVGLREELQRIEHELREARHAERVLRDDLRAGRASQSDYELQLDNSSRLVAQILDVALAFRESHVKAIAAAQAMSSHPTNKGSSSNGTNLADSTLSPGRHNIINYFPEPSPIDPTDPVAALDALRAFDHDHFLEVINKTGSTIRRWQKQCKEYRERAKGKISFRNFAKGDLALFLPTRNSVSKPWAAFNVSFPHYFLQATGHLAEQLKTREWIVARITSITERVVDYKDPSTNPYGLGDGVKYYMLEVEDWTQPAHHSSKHRDSSRRVSSELPLATTSHTLPDTPELPAGPPEPEVEDTFTATRSPTSRLFPSRGRSNSSPTAGPSSLSRLLAQASEQALEPIPSRPRTRTPSPLQLGSRPQSPQQVSSPTPPGSQVQNNHPAQPSPLRPGSRASRVSTSSKFSSRIPLGGGGPAGPKAMATTALSGQTLATPDATFSSSPLASHNEHPSSISDSSAPSPDRSPTEGMSHLLGAAHRRRTTSYHVSTPRPASSATPAPVTTTSTAAIPSSPLASFGVGVGVGAGASASSRLASLASSWGMAFGRRGSSSTAKSGSASGPGTPGSQAPVRRESGLFIDSPTGES